MDNAIKKYISENTEELSSLLHDLCVIPAPSHKEHARVAFCKEWFEKIGVENVYVDEALNVIVPMGKMEDITVFVAHTDTVFPDMEPMPYKEADGKILCPGVGDDTASLAVMMMAIKFLIKNNIKLDGVLFVANSCEEGLGNLKGTRAIMKEYGDRVKQFVSFDGKFDFISTICVGSHRYEVTVGTKGGHSYQSFGNDNAIAELSKMIGKIYEIQVPKIGNSRTTYNVGTISGGTSVNTIAQSASMLCEYRSNSFECLEIMEKHFNEIFEAAKREGVSVEVKRVGERPCGAKLDEKKEQTLVDTCVDIISAVTGSPVTDKPSSTDCNIPLSMSIPAICMGVYSGGGAHTREEWVVKDSLPTGLEIALKVVLALTGKEAQK